MVAVYSSVPLLLTTQTRVLVSGLHTFLYSIQLVSGSYSFCLEKSETLAKAPFLYRGLTVIVTDI